MNGRAVDADINTSSTRRTSSSSRPRKEPTIPGVTLDSGGAEEAVSHILPKQEQPVQQEHGTRRRVSISDIVPDKEEKKDIPGVTLLKSPQDEILKPGGVFDQYVAEKTEEMRQRMAEEEAKRQAAMEEAELGEDEVDEFGDELDEDEADILSNEDAPASEASNVHVNSVSRDDVSNWEAEEEEEEPEVEDEEENFEDVEDSEVPFYQAMKEKGFQDDYEYPEEYNLPEDNFLDDEEEVEDEPTEEVIEDDEEDNETLDHELGAKKIRFVTTDDESVDDIEKEVESDTGEPSDDERLEELRAQIAEKIKPTARKLSLEGWTVANKATASNRIFDTTEASAGKWVLPATGICIEMREISGQKIEYIRENMGNNPTAARNRLKVLYEHVTTPKPQSFEAWTKSIAYADYDHLFMPVYLAAFSDSNYIPQTCEIEKNKIPRKETGCGKMFITDNIPIMKCVKFKDKESESKFWKLYDSDRTNADGLYATEILPISDKFAISFRDPSLYNIFFESASYGKEFSDKYNNIISIMPYIDKVYWLDHANMKMVEVTYKKYENNAAKTAKSKVIRYSKVFDTFSTDEYSNMLNIINSISDRVDWMSYQIPELTCPECGRVIPEEPLSASGLVFTRHRLGILASSSIN
jgi:hypothetical protein